MRKYLKDAAEEIDATVFSGDVLYCPKEREELKMYIGRWQRAIAQQEEIEKVEKLEGDKMIKLTEDQIAIYGRPNFLCSGVAKVLINGGLYETSPDKNKAEYEQAIYIHWSSELLRIHGDNWRDAAQHILDDLEATKLEVSGNDANQQNNT